MTGNSASLLREMQEGFLEINPSDAKELGVKEDELIKVESKRGSVVTKAKLTDRVARGIVFMPFHFFESRANILTNPALDPVAKIPEFKVCAVKIKKIEAQAAIS